MGQRMTLAMLIRKLLELDIDQTIYAVEPWSESSPACLAQETENGGLPNGAASDMKYFLEVSIAIEFIEDWTKYRDSRASEKEICDRLISYAINDA